MTRVRPIEDLAATMAWGPLEQYVPDLSTTGAQPAGETMTGRFRRHGVLAYVSGVATLGASVGNSEYRVSLPTGWTAATVTGMFWVGTGLMLDVSAGVTYDIQPYVSSATTVIGFVYRAGTAAFTSFTSAAPVGLVSGDQFSWSVWFELDSA